MTINISISFLILLLLLQTIQSTETRYYNSDIDCSAGCSFISASIWIGERVPTQGDVVFIQSNSPTIINIDNQVIDLLAIIAYDSTLNIRDSVVSANITGTSVLIERSTVTADFLDSQGSSHITEYTCTNDKPNSTFIISDSTVNINNQATISSLTIFNSIINGTIGGRLFSQFTCVYGNKNTFYATFGVQQEAHFFDTNVYIDFMWFSSSRTSIALFNNSNTRIRNTAGESGTATIQFEASNSSVSHSIYKLGNIFTEPSKDLRMILGDNVKCSVNSGELGALYLGRSANLELDASVEVLFVGQSHEDMTSTPASISGSGTLKMLPLSNTNCMDVNFASVELFEGLHSFIARSIQTLRVVGESIFVGNLTTQNIFVNNGGLILNGNLNQQNGAIVVTSLTVPKGPIIEVNNTAVMSGISFDMRIAANKGTKVLVLNSKNEDITSSGLSVVDSQNTLTISARQINVVVSSGASITTICWLFLSIILVFYL